MSLGPPLLKPSPKASPKLSPSCMLALYGRRIGPGPATLILKAHIHINFDNKTLLHNTCVQQTTHNIVRVLARKHASSSSEYLRACVGCWQ